MLQSYEAMRTALSVLTALTEKRNPDQGDIDRLQVLAGPQPKTMSLDELACEVIQHALRELAAARSVANTAV
jgi:cell division septation protein DedD